MRELNTGVVLVLLKTWPSKCVRRLFY